MKTGQPVSCSESWRKQNANRNDPPYKLTRIIVGGLAKESSEPLVCGKFLINCGNKEEETKGLRLEDTPFVLVSCHLS